MLRALPGCVPASLGLDWFASHQLDKPWHMVVVKEERRMERRRSSKRGRNKGRWRGEQKKVERLVLCQGAWLNGTGVPGPSACLCNTALRSVLQLLPLCYALAPCWSTRFGEVMLLTILWRWVQHKGVMFCIMTSGPKRGACSQSMGSSPGAAGSDTVGLSQSCRTRSRVRDYLKM